MAISKMKFVNVIGKNEDFDYIIKTYLRNFDIQLQSAVDELQNMHDIVPMDSVNPYTPLLNETAKAFGDIEAASGDGMDFDRAKEILTSAAEYVNGIEEKTRELSEKRGHFLDLLNILGQFRDVEFDVGQIVDLEHVHFRFGKMPKDFVSLNRIFTPAPRGEDEPYSKYYFLEHKQTDETYAVFVPSHCDKYFMWGIYFTAKSYQNIVNSVFSSLHFERIFFSNEMEGKPSQRYNELQSELSRTERELEDFAANREKYVTENKKALQNAYFTVKELADCYEARRYAATYKGVFFLVGWMKASDARALQHRTNDDTRCTLIVEDESVGHSTQPPTALKNNRLAKPFEMYLRLYGTPKYGEMDPTLFMAVSYSLLFGIMFGDVGQGLFLLLGGFALYKSRGSSLAGIISSCGFFSVVFGFMYGSIFGNEELLGAVWLRPSHDIMTLLITTVALGSVIIMIVMLFNIIMCIKRRRYIEALMSQNGIAGLAFYAGIVLTVLSMVTGGWFPIWAFGAVSAASLFAVAAYEPVERRLHGEKNIFGGSVGMFITQTFFELFEIVLSYLTNTISFVRVGAFALSHAGMMTVVGVLMEMSGEGSVGYYLVCIIGNIVVVGMEGLIVSIQVLRLEFYEMFSRFFAGGGREFEPAKLRR